MGEPVHPLLGKPTCNAGVILGGIRTKIEGVAASDPQVAYELQPGTFAEASEMDAADPFVDAVAAAVKAATGTRPQVIGMSFTTDARFVRNQAGIPAVVCGPGDVAQAHTND